VRYLAGIREKKINTCRILEEKPKGTRQLRTPKYGWDDNIEMHLK
jgi:hypothetical protein